MESQKHVVFGCNGPVGRGLVRGLVEAGHEVVGVCRGGQARLPKGARVEAGDAADRERTASLARGAHAIHAAVGIPYPQWRDGFMPIVEGLLYGARVNEARLVWTDNLYGYGPRNEPLREDMRTTGYGRKPALRGRMIERMQEEHDRGRVRVTWIRSSDFVGPYVRNAMLGDTFFQRAIDGKNPQFIGDPDQPHTYTYVPDLIRAQLTIAANDDAYGEAWHVPNPPTRTTRAIAADLARRLKRPLKIQTLPPFLLPVLGLGNPVLNELREMQYQWRRPFEVDDSKVRGRFGLEATDWDTILDRTLAWFRRPTH